MCRLLGAENQAQREGETRLRGRGFVQAGEDTSTAALFFLSAFPRQQRNTNSLRCAPGCRGKETRSGSPCPGPARTPQTRRLRSPWLSRESVGFKRLILGEFIFRAKRKEIARPDGARDAHGLCKPPLTQVLIRSSAREPGWGAARGCEVGVRSRPRGSLSRRRPCQSLWCHAR